MSTFDLDLVDTKALLSSLDVEYTEGGKNVTHGWVNISCPFCGDHSNHCGINLKTNLFSCWRCREKGDIVKLIKEIKHLSYRKANLVVGSFLSDPLGVSPFSEELLPKTILRGDTRTSVAYPNPIFDHAPDVHRKYLSSRNFDTDFLTSKYKLKFTHNTGAYRFRIIAPILVENQVVSWIAASVIRKENIAPYIKCPLEKSLVSANSCLYNIDSVDKIAIIVEGITDVWRIGDGCVAMMGKKINSQQIQMLVDKGVESVFVMLDCDAADEAKEMRNNLSPIFKSECVFLSEGDPADFSEEEVKSFRKEYIE